ncbi:MAG: hypothetical protein ACUVV6_03310 [Thermoplasmatota archaeon]
MARARNLLVVALLLAQPLLALPASTESPKGRFMPEGATVLFDEAHFPVYTVNPSNPSGYASGQAPQGAYAEFARVLEGAGFTVRTLDYGYYLDSAALAGVKVLVVVCSQGQDPTGSIRAPYTAEELEALTDFVLNGGGLFLIGDHTTFPPAIFPIAERFNITFAQRLLHDPTDFVHNSTTGEPSDMNGDVFIVFGRDNFNNHPIMRNVTRVELYRTDIFSALPPDAQPLIISDADTYHTSGHTDPFQMPAPHSVVAAALPSNGTAGAGRVVVVADTNTFETDENRDDDPDPDLYDSDNELYGLQICEWLADVPPHRGVELSSAERDTEGQSSIAHNCTQGNSTVFYFRTRNTGNIQDTYDITVEDAGSRGWGFGLSHSGITLRSGEERVMTLTVDVPTSAAVGERGEFSVRARSRTDPAVSAGISCTAVVPAIHELSLICERNRVSVASGGSAVYELSLRNRGNLQERVELAAEGPPGWVARLGLSSLIIAPGEERALQMTVTPPMSALGGEEGRVRVSAIPAAAPEASASADTFTTVIQEFGIELDCPDPELEVDPGYFAVFSVTLTNLGNGHDDVSLSLAGGSPWPTYIEPSYAPLPFNTTAPLSVATRAPPLSPANETVELVLVARSIRDAGARDSLTLRATVRSVSRVRLEVSPPVAHADPGAVAKFRVNVTNTGNVAERVRLSSQEPASLSREELSLSVGESVEAALSVAVPPGAAAWERIFVNVTAASLINSSAADRALAVVVVNQTHSVEPVLDPPRLSLLPGEEGRSSLTVLNEGNGPELVFLSLEGAPPGWVGGADEPLLTIERGGRELSGVAIRPATEALAGNFTLQLNLSYGSGHHLLLPLEVEVLRVHNFTLRVSPEVLGCAPGRTALFSLSVANLGNAPELILLTPLGTHASWARVEETRVSVAPSSERVLTVCVRPGPDAHPGRYSMRVSGRGEDNTTKEVGFTLVVREGATTVGDLPCLVAILIAIVSSAAAGIYIIKKRHWRGVELPPEEAAGEEGGDGGGAGRRG